MTSMEVDGAGTSSARRRRERRLRSWWRHERMSVAAALAEALHHSAPKVGAETHDALRRLKTASAGARPGVLKDPAPQGGSHGRLRGCPGASPLHTVAGGHCSRSSGRPHGKVPPPAVFGPEEEGGGGGGGEEEGGGEAAGGEGAVACAAAGVGG